MCHILIYLQLSNCIIVYNIHAIKNLYSQLTYINLTFNIINIY